MSNKYVLATDEDFVFRGGSYYYIGSDEYVEIPSVIYDEQVTTFQGMFIETNVKGVKADIPGVNNFSNMFERLQSVTLDISELNTSNATNIENMFYRANLETIYVKDESTQRQLQTEEAASIYMTFEVGVAGDYKVEYEYVDFDTKYVETDKLEVGRMEIVQQGKGGVYKVTYELGAQGFVEVAREGTEPVTQIVNVGVVGGGGKFITEVYLYNQRLDRDYFIDKSRTNPIGLSERFGITLMQRPEIPTAELRYDEVGVHGVYGDYAAEDQYDNVEITLAYNFITQRNARETYNMVSNALSKMEPGVRLRFSDDKDGSFRKLARKPVLSPLNNHLLGWGQFEITLVLEPFRYIEQPKVKLTRNITHTLKQPLPNALPIPQIVEHEVERMVDTEMRKNNKLIYSIRDAEVDIAISDGNIKMTYGGDR